jgi:hypothetical protein
MAGYDRDKAIAYAAKFWNRVCDDGCVALLQELPPGKPKPTKIAKVPPGTLLRDWQEPSGWDEDDCTHFVSCCIGRHGGGLPLGVHDFPPAYGSLSPRSLIKVLSGRLTRLAEGVQTLPPSVESQWIEGDLVAYGEGKDDDFSHMALHVGAGMITCHTMSRWLDSYDLVARRPMTFLHIKA